MKHNWEEEMDLDIHTKYEYIQYGLFVILFIWWTLPVGLLHSSF